MESQLEKDKVEKFLNELAWVAINLPLAFHTHECDSSMMKLRNNMKFDDDEENQAKMEAKL